MRRRTFEIVAWHNRATICARALRELGANVTRRDVLRYWSGMLPWRWLGRRLPSPDAGAVGE
jgi:hypothetical protein